MTYILLSIIALLLIAIITMAVKWPKVIELSDIAPKDNSPKNNWLQLQNEGGKYVRIENGRIKLKIVK
jgi:hypothetical protein